MSKCGCRPNMFCQMVFKDCSSCVRHRSCDVGYGVSKPGTSPTFSITFDNENQGEILKKLFSKFFCQEQLTRTWGASRVQRARSLTKALAQTPVSLIKGGRRTALPVANKTALAAEIIISVSFCLSSCQGRVIRAGNATANTVCQPRESFPTPAKVFATPTTASAATPAVVAPSVSPPAPEVFFKQSTKSPLPSSISDKNLGAAADTLL